MSNSDRRPRGRYRLLLPTILLILVASPADARPADVQSRSSVETAETLVDLEVGTEGLTRIATTDLRGQPTALALEGLRGAAQEGALMDLASIRLYQTRSGLVVGLGAEHTIESVIHRVERLSTTDDNGLTSAIKQEEMRVLVGPGTDDDALAGDLFIPPDTPLGFGSLALEGLSGNKCYWATATYDSDNTMYWCYNKRFVDGGNGGNGRRAYGAWDDDGSRWRDYYGYERWATVQPDQTPLLDYAVMEAHVFSWPTYNTIKYRWSKLLDWTPTDASCSKDSSFSLSAGAIGWSVPACSSGTDISFTKNDGRFKHRYSCIICNTGTRYVGFHIGVEVKQGTIPYWYDDNYARFRQSFNPNSAIIDD